MKSKTNQDELHATIQQELGIDLTKYRNEEVAENLLDLLIFPKYIMKWVARPLLLCLLFFVIGFFVIDLVHIQYLLYGILGFFLFFFLGVLLGVINFGRRLGNDVSSIADYSLGIMKNSMIDIGGVGDRVNKGNVRDVMGMLFKGIMLIVTIPMLNKAIDKKIPKGGNLIKRMLSGSLIALSNKVSFDPDKIDENEIHVDGDSKFVAKYSAVIEKTQGNLSDVVSKVIKIVSTPFRLGSYIVGFLLLLFIYLIW